MEQKKNKSKYSKIGLGPFKCSSCLEEKEKKEFSRKQILKEDRKCRSCVDKIIHDIQENKIVDQPILRNNFKNSSNKGILCYNCKKRGHIKSECIKKGGGGFNPGGMDRQM